MSETELISDLRRLLLVLPMIESHRDIINRAITELSAPQRAIGMAHELCMHDLAEKETACADGLCPICLQMAVARTPQASASVPHE